MRAPLPQLLISSIALVSLLSVGACSSSAPIPSKSSDAYRGPPLSLASTPPQHRVILSAPGGGWSFQLDQTRRAFDHTDVFLTIIRPNPAYMYTLGMVQQEAGTEIDPSERLVIYARVLNHDVKPGSQSYNEALVDDHTAVPQ